MDYTIIGGGVNLASRLEAAATPGEILISYETYANVRHRIHCEERGHISVKGIAYPVATYQVVDTYENLGTERLFIHEERPNLKLDLDLDAMSADDRGHAAAVLREALNRCPRSIEGSKIAGLCPEENPANSVGFCTDKFRSGSKPVRLRTSNCFPVCPRKRTSAH